MKSLLTILILFICMGSFAQKPKTLTQLPDTIECPKAELDRIFRTEENGSIILQFPPVALHGVITGKKQVYSNLRKVNVKLVSVHNAIFNLSEVYSGTDSAHYVGRIADENSLDAMLLQRIGGSYYLVKVYDLVPDICIPSTRTENMYTFQSNVDISTSMPLLNSNPGALFTIFLDFDGYQVNTSSWNGGTPFYATPAGLSDAQITEAFLRCSEDYRPFTVNVTTDSTVFLATALTRRQRIVVTNNSAWYPNAGGVAYVGSFTWGDDTPGFVFSDKLGPYNPKMVGEASSHESGHTVGLSHQASYDANCALISQYRSGVGTGETGWAPIMGNSYYNNASRWSNGPTPYTTCTGSQDELNIIATKNGFSYRPHQNKITIGSNNFSYTSIITTNSDKDTFQFGTDGGAVHIQALPYSVAAGNSGANLDIQLSLVSSSGAVIATSNPTDQLGAAIDAAVNPGTYYIIVDGVGNANNFNGNYGSVGQFTISGNLAVSVLGGALKNVYIKKGNKTYQ